MSGRTIRCTAVAPDDDPVPLFLGRDDGTVEKYISIADAELGQPSLVLRGHTKAVTGLSATSADELYSCALDGSLVQWNASDAPPATGRVMRRIVLASPLRCLVAHEGRLYAGGQDGSLYIIDGERRAVWPGHAEAIACIAFTTDGLIVSGGADNQIRLWDAASGRCIRLLQGHTGPVRGLYVIDSLDDAESEEGMQGVLLSLAQDNTLKVWPIPDPSDRSAEQDTAMFDYANDEDGHRNVVVSFQVPEGDTAAAAAEAAAPLPAEEGSEGAEKSGESAAVVTAGGGEEGEGNDEAAAAGATTNNNDNNNNEDEELDSGAAGQNASMEKKASLDSLLRGAQPTKSAMKLRSRPYVPRLEAVATIALPAIPLCVCPPLNESLAAEQASHGTDSGNPLLFVVGASDGTLLGFHTQKLRHTVLQFVAHHESKAQKALRETRQLVRQSIALTRRQCRRAIKLEEGRWAKVARRVQKAAKAEARAKRKEERQAQAAERARLRAIAREENDEDEDEEEPYDEDEDGDAEEEEEQEEEEEEEEEEYNAADGEGGNGLGGGPQGRLLRLLTEEQQHALKDFIAVKEKERDEKIRALQEAAERHMRAIEPVARAKYTRTKEVFDQLPFTQRVRVGADGVLALVRHEKRLYVAQADRIVPAVMTMSARRV